MGITYIVPKYEETFGVLEFGGLSEEVTEGYGNNAKVKAREYHLFGELQEEGLKVRVPSRAGVKDFEYDAPVKLVRPRLTTEVYRVGNDKRTRWICEADDIILANE